MAELVTEDGETTILVQQQESDQHPGIFQPALPHRRSSKADFLDAIMQSQTDEHHRWISTTWMWTASPSTGIRIDGTYRGDGVSRADLRHHRQRLYLGL